MKAGLALNLSMPIEQVMSYIGSFDYLLLMTSEPDGCGQRFRSCALERIRRARACIPDEVMIYADGGIGRDELGRWQRQVQIVWLWDGRYGEQKIRPKPGRRWKH